MITPHPGTYRYGQGWNFECYYGTLRLLACEGELYLCGRGPNHFFLEKYSPSTNSWRALATHGYSTDISGWNNKIYYSTIQVAAIHDKIYCFGRGMHNINLLTYSPSADSWSIENFPWLTDSVGWSNAKYYETIRLSVLSDKLFIVARGARVVHIGEFNPATGKLTAPPIAPEWMGDSEGFDQPQYYSTIRVQAFNQRVFIFTRTPKGAQIAYYDPAEQRFVQTPPVSLFIDGDGWELPKCYRTIRAEAHQGKWYICGKGIRSVLLVCFDTQSYKWTILPTTTSPLTLMPDAAEYYETFRTAIISDKLVLFARGGASSFFLNFNLRTREWEPPITTDLLSELKYNDPSYYSTVMTATIGDRMYVCMRGEEEVKMISYESPQA